MKAINQLRMSWRLLVIMVKEWSDMRLLTSRELVNMLDVHSDSPGRQQIIIDVVLQGGAVGWLAPEVWRHGGLRLRLGDKRVAMYPDGRARVIDRLLEPPIGARVMHHVMQIRDALGM